MSKHTEKVIEILDKKKIKSTNQVLKELEKATNKKINWHVLYRILMELEASGKAEKLQADAGFFWRKC